MALITISRSIGCGGMIIARLVANGLKIELFDDHKLQQQAMEMGIRPEEFKELDEKAPGFLDRIFTRKPEMYLDYMEALVYEVAKKGEGVIIGHGSQMLLRDFECALHVHIYADEATRIRNLMKLKGMSEEASRKLIKKSDHEKEGFFRFAFHMDWSDPSLYDLIINTEQIGLDLAAKIIMEVAGSDQMEACSLTAAESMERLSLVKRIQVVLLENNCNISTLSIDMPEKGFVKISGLASSQDSKKRILKTLKSIPFVEKVQDDIGILDYGNK